MAVLPIPVIGVMQYFKRKNNGLPVDLRDAASKIIIKIIKCSNGLQSRLHLKVLVDHRKQRNC